MKKIFIGLLIIAAGAGIYYLLSAPKNNVPVTENRSALLIGNWKSVASGNGTDSSGLSGMLYEVQKDGLVLVRDSATVAADTVYYSWTTAGDLQLNPTKADSTRENFNVVLLNKDSLQLKDKFNKLHLFIRI